MTTGEANSVIAIIPAAGTGSRLQAVLNRPKQFAELGGKPILAHTLLKFQHCKVVDGIIIPTIPKHIELIRHEILGPFGLDKVLDVIPGGESRQASVWQGLTNARKYNPEIVAVHDAARPFISPDIIAESVQVARKSGGCLTAVPVNDTVKRVQENQIVDTLDRTELWAAQTPQTFRFPLLVRAFERALSEQFTATDESMLVERLGEPVQVIPGSARNMKITTPEDLKIAEAIMRLVSNS